MVEMKTPGKDEGRKEGGLGEGTEEVKEMTIHYYRLVFIIQYHLMLASIILIVLSIKRTMEC